jgi:hypothetical protein
VAFRGPKTDAADLQTTFDLSSTELEVAFTVFQSEQPLSRVKVKIFHEEIPASEFKLNAARFFHVLEQATFNDEFFVEIGSTEAAEISSIHEELANHDSRVLNLEPFLAQLSQLKSLPHESPLRFLGYFALIEGLLTHAPRPQDPYDSITRQIKKKLALLNHRWHRPIDYSSFGSTDPEKVWTTMYKYRSLVAHGGVPDFKKDLDVLNSYENALKLIKDTTKAVIRYALSEPQLLMELREC